MSDGAGGDRHLGDAVEPPGQSVLGPVARAAATQPGTGRLIAGLLLDDSDVDVVSLKGEFPLLERLATDADPLAAAMTYALAMGWEVFGPALSAAVGLDVDDDGISEGLAEAMRSVAISSRRSPG